MTATLRLQALALAAALAVAPRLAGAADLPQLGASTVEAQAKLGVPTAVRSAADGTAIWEYAGKPSSYETYFLVFSGNGRLRSVRQVIDDKTFARIKMGMTQAQVRALLGTPWRITDWDDDADDDVGEILEYRGRDARGTYKFHIEINGHDRTVVAVKVRDIAGDNRRAAELTGVNAASLPKH